MRVRSAAAAGLVAMIAGAAACGYASPRRGGEGKRPEVGAQAPPLALKELFQAPTGAVASWDALKGRTVVLEFWSTGCGPCLTSIPHMNDLAEAMRDKPVQFIAITSSDSKLIERFIAKRRMAAWVGIDKNGATSKAYGVHGIPHTVLVDANGKIAAVTHPSQLHAENILNVVAGRDSGIEPREGGRCDIRKRGCGTGGGGDVKVTIRKAEGEGGSKYMYGGGSIEIASMEPEEMLRYVYHFVYDIPYERIELQAKLPEDVRYDLTAKAPSREKDDLKEPLKAAVEKEFGLASRLEKKNTDVYVLTVDSAKKGLVTRSDESLDDDVAHVDGRQIILINCPIGELTERLERSLELPVVDETGLTGNYDLAAEWGRAGDEEMIKALRDQLGLVLTRAQRPVEMLTVTNAKGAGAK